MRTDKRALAVCAAAIAGLTMLPVSSRADDESDAKLRALQQQIDALSQQVDQLRRENAARAQGTAATQGAQSSAPPPAPGGSAQPENVAGTPYPPQKTGKETKADTPFDKFMKGFFGTLDLSVDYTTKGMGGLEAFPYGYASGAPGSPFVITGPQKAAPYGKVGWLGAMSSNGSNIGYRGSHAIPGSDVDFIYQVTTAFDVSAAPGLQDTWTKQSNTVIGALGLGDTWLGFRKHSLGTIKFGEMYMPYKTSTDRLNPFSTGLGNYAVIMGNTGGDNRVEFGTRLDHVVSYTSPNLYGVTLDAAYAFGQNVDPNNNLTPLGSTDCAGSNIPGSGNLPLNCDDGGFDDAYSADLHFEMQNVYLVAAYELHKRVNRSSDGVGSNNPYYGYLDSLGPNNALSARLLDWADYQAYAQEYPQAAGFGSPEYSTAYDVADEWAMKFGGQYSFDFGLTVSYLWEELHRDVPQIMEFQNERQRTGDWVALQQTFNEGHDILALGWAHAGATPGDPGGQHNFNPNGIGDNEANMYTMQYWHKFDKQLTAYFDVASTINDGNAHYDIGAGGHGIKTDCHDATHPQFIDYSSAGPTTWGGCHPLGFSTGINYKF